MKLFSTIKKEKEYWLVDQVKQPVVSERDYEETFQELLREWNHKEVDYLSLLMDETFEVWLLKKGFHKVSVIVEYTVDLHPIHMQRPDISSMILADSEMTDETFAHLYEQCRSGSANKNILFTIEQIMESFELELGPDWRSHCMIFQKEDQPVGISIPHIEPGTKEEGRLFYFGILPKWRGKGVGTVCHQHSLEALKGFGATYYVGSTDAANAGMIRIFENNGCVLRDRKGIYRIDRPRTV
ncbi:GNAT family N-acetyltransferase [Sporosarcina gallistercoris]|uniref:GNAT family N-acetyltransferase n=1 Tax=Sporosarcina gallistercoris TaxID=2762245 RepID=A0ABR8PHU2_9BACL|nr:GNAT family N-acetyltransferase [Sporosarcina gallistercoris]MBD7907713.1 GNAT family N-acetyltransferase [Sporosarcina gallistercoris]